jgi:hypothetical protein
MGNGAFEKGITLILRVAGVSKENGPLFAWF